MAFNLPLPESLASQRWKVKIRDRERCEPPHVTILNRSRTWRWNLRTRTWMDADPDPAEVPSEIAQLVEQEYDHLCEAWDAMYPLNPVVGEQ